MADFGMGAALFQLESVTRCYGARCAVSGVTFDLRRGETLALVGPSGAGKSTLLRLLNFLEAPSSGVLHFEGRPIDPLASSDLPTRRRVTTVFQRPALLRQSARENVAYGLRLRGLDNALARADAALERVGLLARAGDAAHTLSGGEAQRVALARALVIEPDVLLLDEPTANLDPANVRLIEAATLAERRARGLTCVWVTHNLAQARRVADRVGLMLDGELVELAAADHFFDAPTDPRAAAYVNGERLA